MYHGPQAPALHCVSPICTDHRVFISGEELSVGAAQVARVLYRQLQHPEELRAVPHRKALL